MCDNGEGLVVKNGQNLRFVDSKEKSFENRIAQNWMIGWTTPKNIFQESRDRGRLRQGLLQHVLQQLPNPGLFSRQKNLLRFQQWPLPGHEIQFT